MLGNNDIQYLYSYSFGVVNLLYLDGLVLVKKCYTWVDSKLLYLFKQTCNKKVIDGSSSFNEEITNNNNNNNRLLCLQLIQSSFGCERDTNLFWSSAPDESVKEMH